MSTTAEYRRGAAVLLLALAALVPGRSGVAQVTSSTSLPAATTTSTTAVTTTSSTVPTGTTIESSSTVPFVTLPFDDPLFTVAPDTSSVGPTMTGDSIYLTITTVGELPFSTPFSRATTTTVGLETIAFSTTTSEPATTTTTTIEATTTTAAPPQRLQIATVPAPAPASSGSGSSSGVWTALAGVAVLAAAVMAWRRLRGVERG